MAKRLVTPNTEKLRMNFLEELRNCGSVAIAAEKTGVPVTRPIYWAKRDEEYAKLMDEAREDGEKVLLAVLEREVDRRALEGWTNPVFQKGEQVGENRFYSDNLLMFRIKKLSPSYRERPPDNLVHAGNITIQVASFAALPAVSAGSSKMLPLPAERES